jgi:hypothetical protein
MKRWIAIGILAYLCLVLFLSMRSTVDELNSVKAELNSVQGNLEATLDSLNFTQAELADLQLSYDGLIGGHGYTIVDPTYKQMMDFIRKDRTDKRQYIEDEYVCANFAMDVCNNAEGEGIRCAYVVISYPESSHAIVAFNTIDRELAYIEPQSDELVNLQIGKHFYKCVVPKPGYYYEEPDYDDTIEEILVIW